MTWYAATDASNNVAGFVEAFPAPANTPDITYRELAEPVTSYPVEPFQQAILKWDDGLVWHDPRTLEQAKAGKDQEINAARLAASRATFTYGGKEFSADALARSDIDGINGYVTLINDFPPNWPGAWRSTDGTVVEITTVAHWQAFYAAMVTQGVEFFLYAQSLKAALAAAESLEEVNDISW